MVEVVFSQKLDDKSDNATIQRVLASSWRSDISSTCVTLVCRCLTCLDCELKVDFLLTLDDPLVELPCDHISSVVVLDSCPPSFGRPL